MKTISIDIKPILNKAGIGLLAIRIDGNQALHVCTDRDTAAELLRQFKSAKAVK